MDDSNAHLKFSEQIGHLGKEENIKQTPKQNTALLSHMSHMSVCVL